MAGREPSGSTLVAEHPRTSSCFSGRVDCLRPCMNGDPLAWREGKAVERDREPSRPIAFPTLRSMKDQTIVARQGQEYKSLPGQHRLRDDARQFWKIVVLVPTPF